MPNIKAQLVRGFIVHFTLFLDVIEKGCDVADHDFEVIVVTDMKNKFYHCTNHQDPIY